MRHPSRNQGTGQLDAVQAPRTREQREHDERNLTDDERQQRDIAQAETGLDDAEANLVAATRKVEAARARLAEVRVA